MWRRPSWLPRITKRNFCQAGASPVCYTGTVRSEPETDAIRPNEYLRYWRRRDLGDATLMQAHYGPFKWEKHVHDEQVIVISERGSGEVETRRGRDVGGPGSIWVFAPGEYHFGLVGEGHEWHYRALYLDQTALEIIAKQIGAAEDGRLLVKPGLHYDPEVSQCLLRAHAHGQVDIASEQVAWNDAFARLFAKYGDPRPKRDEPDHGKAGLYLAREYIAEHFRGEISVNDLALLSNLSRYHFIRAFRATFGLPPHAYINQVRLQHARKLLLAGRSAVAAASESGFYDQGRLNYFFKRSYGVTPARYANLISL